MILKLQESWAICRIFKKTNSTAQRALSHSWVSPLPEPSTPDHMLTKDQDSSQFCSANMPLTKKTCLASQLCCNNNDTQHSTTNSISNLYPLDVPSYKSIINPLLYKAFDHLPFSNGDLSNSLVFSSPLETSNNNNAKSTMDVSSMLLNMSSSVLGDLSNTSEGSTTTSFGGLQEHCSGYSIPLLREMQGIIGNQYDNALVKFNNKVNVPRVDDQDLETLRSVGFPFGMPFNIGDAWKSNVHWDTSSCPCDVPSSYSTTKCYT